MLLMLRSGRSVTKLHGQCQVKDLGPTYTVVHSNLPLGREPRGATKIVGSDRAAGELDDDEDDDDDGGRPHRHPPPSILDTARRGCFLAPAARSSPKPNPTSPRPPGSARRGLQPGHLRGARPDLHGPAPALPPAEAAATSVGGGPGVEPERGGPRALAVGGARGRAALVSQQPRSRGPGSHLLVPPPRLAGLVVPGPGRAGLLVGADPDPAGAAARTGRHGAGVDPNHLPGLSGGEVRRARQPGERKPAPQAHGGPVLPGRALRPRVAPRHQSPRSGTTSEAAAAAGGGTTAALRSLTWPGTPCAMAMEA